MSLNFYKEYLFGFETLVFATLGISSMHNQLVTLQRERKNEIASYDPFNKYPLNSSKVTVKTFIMLKNQIIKYHIFHKSIKQHNIDKNKKFFLSSELAYYNDFWSIMWHWSL